METAKYLRAPQKGAYIVTPWHSQAPYRRATPQDGAPTSLAQLASTVWSLPTSSLRFLALVMLAVVACCIGSGAYADSVQYTYDAAGRLNAVIDPVNGSAIYNYDTVGNLLSVTRNPITSLVIAQVTPNSAAPGALITIAGTGFGATSNTTVSFNGASSVPSTVTTTSITVAVPPGATTGPIKITSPAGSATTASSFTVTPQSAPMISGFSPTTALPGATLTINGSGFSTVLANNRVFVNGAGVALTSATATTLVGTLPVVTSGHVSVETPGGSTTTTSILFVPPLGSLVPPIAYSTSSVASGIQSALGASATATTTAASQINLITFDAIAGQRVAMQVVSSSAPAGYFSLFGPSGVQLGLPTVLTAGTFFDTQNLASGTYTVVVNPTQASSTTLSLINVPADPSATVLTNGSATTLTSTVPGQNFQLLFSGAAGNRISLLTQESTSLFQSGACFGVTITDPDGATPLYSNPTQCAQSDFSDVLTLPTSGTYGITVNPSGTVTGAATFMLYGVPADPTATIAANATPTTLTTTVPGQNFELTFSGAAGSRISLLTQESSSLNAGGCYTVTITAPDGVTQVYNSTLQCATSSFSDAVALMSTGTYTITLNPQGLAVGGATFTLYTVPPDPTAAITPNGSTTTLTTTAPGQNFELTFSGTAGSQISLSSQENSALYNTSSTVGDVIITEPDGITQLYSGYLFSMANYSGTVALPSTGNYTISLNPTGLGVGSASFTLSTIPPNVAGTISANGTPVSLTNTTAGQSFQLTFQGTAGNRIGLLTQEGNSLYQLGKLFSVSITEPNGTTQLYDQPGEFGQSDFSDVLALPVTGTYTILLNPNGTGVGTATFTLYTVPTNAAGTVVAGGGSVGLTVTAPGQNVQLNFSATAGSRVALLSQADSVLSQQCAALTITDPDGSTQLYNHSYCSSSNFTGALPTPSAISTTIPTLTQTGTYSVLLNPSSNATGTATFTLYAVPADVTGTFAIGQSPINLTTLTPGQSARAAFSGAASQNATVRVTASNEQPASSCLTVTTLEPDGQTILRQDLTCSSSYSSSSLTLPVAGNYTVVVTPSSTMIGSFAISATSP